MPAMPHKAAGPRIEPPVSVPMPPRISPAATAAPVPLLLPAVKPSVSMDSGDAGLAGAEHSHMAAENKHRT
jgi:hypothetical protein